MADVKRSAQIKEAAISGLLKLLGAWTIAVIGAGIEEQGLLALRKL